MPKDKSTKSTQSYLRVQEIKQDTMIMTDNTHAAAIAVSSTNFALKSQEEQNALVYGYQAFLNTLDFDIQILMQSRKIDIHAYIEKLNHIMEQQTNELLRVQTAEYIEFIGKLVESSSVMNKNFYVIIPYRPALVGKDSKGGGSPSSSGGFFSFLKRKNETQVVAEKLQDFQDYKIKLDQRVTTVMNGLSGLGLKSLQLETPEIIELLYNSYNFETGPLIDVSKLSDIKIKEPRN